MLSPKHNLVYSRTRITRDNGSFYDVVEVTAPDVTKLEFHKGIHCNSHLKLDDIAQLRMLKALARGIPKPTALLWDAYGHEEAIEEVDLMNQGTDMVHISKNSSITHHLRYLVETCNYVITDGRLQVKDLATEKDRKTQEILDLLYAQERIKLYQGDPDQTLEEIYLGFDPRKDVVSVGRIGLPSLHGRMGNYPIAFNTSFFLFEEEDYISEFSLLGDAYSLQIREGVIESPPLFNRSALLISTTGEVGLRQISLQDLKLDVLGQTWDLSAFSLNQAKGQAGDYALYTRYFGVEESGKTWTHTPKALGKVEFIIIDRSIVGFKRGGETEIPHNGFVLSLPEGDTSLAKFTNEVNYSFLDSSYNTGIQCGPGLLKDGEIILHEQTLKEEQFFRKNISGGKVLDYGVVPTDYAMDIHRTQAARLAIGVDFDGRFRVLAVEGVNRGMEEETGESSGASLQELSLVLKNRGYKHALNLDGGGSA
ncbi:MAG TPA: hypothetical protein DDZ66_03355, partial [Firmicutes bacterium]|nr:hypothetical protein [Bacillota bacterium]